MYLLSIEHPTYLNLNEINISEQIKRLRQTNYIHLSNNIVNLGDILINKENENWTFVPTIEQGVIFWRDKIDFLIHGASQKFLHKSEVGEKLTW